MPSELSFVGETLGQDRRAEVRLAADREVTIIGCDVTAIAVGGVLAIGALRLLTQQVAA